MANGKGDKRRQKSCTQEEWDRNWEAIFGGYEKRVKELKKKNKKTKKK